MLTDARHHGGHEHGRGDLVREPLHGEHDGETAIAVADQDKPLAGRSCNHGVEQCLRLVLKGVHLLDARQVDAGRGDVDRGHGGAPPSAAPRPP